MQCAVGDSCFYSMCIVYGVFSVVVRRPTGYKAIEIGIRYTVIMGLPSKGIA